MANLRVNWAPDKLLTFEEVLEQPGWYFNAISGDLFFYNEVSETTKQDAKEIEKAFVKGLQPQEVEPRHWLLITDDLDLSEGDARSMLRDAFHVRMEDQGRLVGTQTWRRS